MPLLLFVMLHYLVVASVETYTFCPIATSHASYFSVLYFPYLGTLSPLDNSCASLLELGHLPQN